MNKVEIIATFNIYDLEREINDFGRKHEIVSVSLSTNKDEYCACVVYKEAGDQNG